MAQLPQYKDAYRIAWMIEPPAIRQDTYQFISKYYQLFDLILTHQKDLVKLIPNAEWYPSHMSWISENDWGKYVKSDNISIIASDKTWTQGHRLRHELINSFDIKPFDIYGSCTGKFLKNKIDAIDKYRFSIAIENSRTNGYYTEKLVDNLSTYTVPIYYGCPDIERYFDINGIINCKSLEDIINAIDFVLSSPEEIYDSYKPYLENNFNKAKQWFSPEDYIYEKILLPKKLV
jgi:hypothetical protein